jgi:hypothetical protein
MGSAQAGASSASAQLAAFEAIRLRSAAAADRVVAQAEAIADAEMYNSAAAPGHRASKGRVDDSSETECDEVQGWLR